MKRILLYSAIFSLLCSLSGCYENDIVHTYHPERGLVILAVDPPVLEEDESMPSSYTLEVNGVRGEVVDGQVTFASLVEPGTYELRIFNETNAVSVDDSGVASTPCSGSITELSDEHVYFGAGEITISADYNDLIEVQTAAVTRKLTFEIGISEGDVDKVANIELNLSGIASEWHCFEGRPMGTAKSVNSTFELVPTSKAMTKGGDGQEDSATTGYSLRSSLYLLGTIGAEQSLVAVVHYDNGNTQTITSDLGDELIAFNDDKSSAKVLQSTTPLLSESNFTATITNWKALDESYDFDVGPGEELELKE